MKNLVFPNYQHSLLNITSSILKYYHVDLGYPTLNNLDQALLKQPKNIVYILIDALGSEILKKHQDVADCLINHQIDTLTTVFPSTTTSATTSALTGLPPISTGWIGWQQYIKEENSHVVFFLNKDFYHEEKIFSESISETYVKQKKIYDLILENNKDVKVHEIFPAFSQPHHDSFTKQVDTCIDILSDRMNHFIYVYWDQVDSKLHDYGTSSNIVKDEIRGVNEGFEKLLKSIDDDTLVILTADHGQIDIEPIPLMSYSDIIGMLKIMPSIESRATAFHVKEEYLDVFPLKFNEYFGEHYILYQSSELIDMNLFGIGKEHSKFKEMIGDYFAIAINHYAFQLTDHSEHKATHAGLTKDEMLIPLITNGLK